MSNFTDTAKAARNPDYNPRQRVESLERLKHSVLLGAPRPEHYETEAAYLADLKVWEDFWNLVDARLDLDAFPELIEWRKSLGLDSWMGGDAAIAEEEALGYPHSPDTETK